MKTYDELMEKIYVLRERELSGLRKKLLSRSPVNCIHNQRARVKTVGKIGFCHCRTECAKLRMESIVCDDEVPDSCTSFECRNTESDVLSMFDDIIRNPSRCGAMFPKLAVLLWVIQDPDDEVGEPDAVPVEHVSGGGFFAMLKRFFKGGGDGR